MRSAFFHNSRRVVALLLSVLLAASAAPGAFAADRPLTLTADLTRWHADDTVTAEGNVEATYEDYKVTADSAHADLETNIAVFEGNVSLATKDRTVKGESLTLNLKTRDWTLRSANTRLGSETFKNNAHAVAFIKSEELSADADSIAVKSGSFTTCDLDHPHYCIDARSLDIYPESRVVARKVSFIGLDKRLFSLNHLVIPIRGIKSNIIPQVGSSAEEGMFLKAAYAYMATSSAQGIAKLDLMTKRGIGFGVEQTYKWSGANGLLNVYFLNDRELGSTNLTGSLQHQQRFGELGVSLRGDYRTNNYLYYSSSKYKNYQVALTRNVGPASTSLTHSIGIVDGLGNSNTATTSLRHTQRLSSDLTGRMSLNLKNYRSSYFEGVDKELNTELELNNRSDKFDATLVYSKRNDLDGDSYTGDRYYGGLDRMPEFLLETDTHRLMDKPLLDLPFRFKFGYGQYTEAPSGENRQRLLFQADLLNKVIPIGDKTDLSLSGGFRQTVYASDMAQTVLRTNLMLTTRYNDLLTSRFSYGYQRPDGYTPFRFDYSGKYNNLRANFDYRDADRLVWSLSSGYAVGRPTNPWQDLTLRLTANPARNFGGSLSTGYDLNRGEWRSLISRVSYSAPDWLSLDLGTRYNLKEGSMDSLRSRLALKIGSKWSADALVSWNGFTKEFDYRAFRVTRDLHCWEASLVFTDEMGFRKDKGIMLDLRLKAFRGEDRFGIGQYGQTFDTGMGEYYY